MNDSNQKTEEKTPRHTHVELFLLGGNGKDCSGKIRDVLFCALAKGTECAILKVNDKELGECYGSHGKNIGFAGYF